MTKAVCLKTHFEIPASFNFEKISSSRFGIHWGDNEEKVVIRFSPEAVPYLFERTWHHNQQTRKEPDGSAVMELNTIISFELKKWILSWGSQAKVISPQHLVDTVKTEIKNLLQNY